MNFSFSRSSSTKIESFQSKFLSYTRRQISTSLRKVEGERRKEAEEEEKNRLNLSLERERREKRGDEISVREFHMGDKVFPLEAAPLLSMGRADRQTKALEKRWSKNHPWNRRCMDPCARSTSQICAGGARERDGGAWEGRRRGGGGRARGIERGRRDA